VTGDIVNPHYYAPGRGVVEDETQVSPTPIVHLSIEPGTVFKVVAGIECRTLRGLGSEALEELKNEALKAGLLRKDEAQGGARVGGCPEWLYKLVARLVGAAFLSGFAARSGKGYNILRPLRPEEVKAIDRSIVGIAMQAARAKGGQKQAKQAGGGGKHYKSRGRG